MHLPPDSFVSRIPKFGSVSCSRDMAKGLVWRVVASAFMALAFGLLTSFFAPQAGASPAPNSRVRVLIYGYLDDGLSVRTCLDALLREDFETVEVDFQSPPSAMLYDSYYRTDKREILKGHLKAKAYDYAILVDNETMAGSYPEFWYSGVSAVAARAREFSNARTLLWIPSSPGLENGYRVANGTSSTA